MKFSSCLQRFKEPETLRMAKLGRELRAKGYDITDLSLGEPDFDTPDHIKKALIEAVEQNYSHYPPVSGYADLKEAICLKFERDNNLKYSPENIMVSTGAKQSIANVVLALIDFGDEAIIPVPYWVTYSEIVKLAGGNPVTVKTDIRNKYKITPDDLAQVITPKSKLFIFSSPCNPTGSIYSKEELSALANEFLKYPDIFIISDEIYEYINYIGKHESIAQFDKLKDRVIVINGLSKGFAMTGYRLGYLAANAEIVKACDKLQGQFTSGANAVTQRAAIAALTGDLTSTLKMVEAFKARRKRILELFNEIPEVECIEPDGAFYVFPTVNKYFGKQFKDATINNAHDLCMYLLQQACVSTVPGDAFGNPDCIRVSFANSMENIEKGMQKLKVALQALK